MINVVATVSGQDTMEPALRFHRAFLGDKVEKGLRKFAEKILERSRYYVPEDTTALFLTGKVVRTEGSGMKSTYAVTYGDEDVYYAGYVSTQKKKRHGAEYNAHYAARIAAHLDHARHPQETADFMEEAMLEAVAEVENFTAELRVNGKVTL